MSLREGQSGIPDARIRTAGRVRRVPPPNYHVIARAVRPVAISCGSLTNMDDCQWACSLLFAFFAVADGTRLHFRLWRKLGSPPSSRRRQQSTGLLHLIVRVPSLHKNLTGYPKWDNLLNGTAKLTKSEPNPASARAVSTSSSVMVSAPSLWLKVMTSLSS